MTTNATVTDEATTKVLLDIIATKDAEIARLREALEWQPIETAPEGTPRKPGAVSYFWMMLAVPDDEGGYHKLSGFRCNDEFFAACTFYRGGLWTTRQLCLKECQVYPTHWMPLPDAPDPIPDPAGGMPVEVE